MYYLEKVKVSPQANNAYEILLYAQSSMIFPVIIQESAHILSMRVDENFTLPTNQDPILAAEVIITWVINNISKGD